MGRDRPISRVSIYPILILTVLGIILSSVWPFTLTVPDTARLSEAFASSPFELQQPKYGTILERVPFFLVGALTSGIAAWRTQSLIKSSLLLVGFAASIELAQLFISNRHARWNDLFLALSFSFAGTVFGHVYRRIATPRLGLATRFASMIALLSAATLLGINGNSAASLDEWNCDLPFHIGNESGRDRGWQGEIVSLAAGAQNVELSIVPSPSLDAPLEIGRGDLHIFEGDSTAFCRAAKSSRAFSLTAKIRSVGVDLQGPARILSWSEDIFRQNVLLGEAEQAVVFRVTTGLSGAQKTTEVKALIPTAPHEIVTVKAVYKNGRMQILFNDSKAAQRDVSDLVTSSGFFIPRGLGIALLSILALLIIAPVLIESTSNRRAA